MKIEEVLRHIRNLNPLPLSLLVSINKMTDNEKITIIEEYNLQIIYLLSIIHNNYSNIQLIEDKRKL